MLSPFQSSKALVSRAQEHFNQFNELQNAYVASNIDRFYTELDEERGEILCKIKIPSIDERLPVLVFDTVNALRSALDHAVFDSARVLGSDPDPTDTKFPFGKELADLQGELQKQKTRNIPLAIRPLLISFEPYKSGKNGLWQLNQLRNQKIHRILQPMALGNEGIGIKSNFSGSFYLIEDCSRWDEDEGVLTFAIFDAAGTTADLKAHIRPIMGISFGQPLYGPKADDVLSHFIDVVDRTILSIESETARLKI